MKGRRPKPTRLKLLGGNASKRPINLLEPQPTSSGIRCPSFLSAQAKAEWRRRAPELERLGLLTLLDVPALALHCSSFALVQEMDADIAENGATYAAKDLKKRNPACAIREAAMAGCLSVMKEFGMTPASRSRLHAEPVDDFQQWSRTEELA